MILGRGMKLSAIGLLPAERWQRDSDYCCDTAIWSDAGTLEFMRNSAVLVLVAVMACVIPAVRQRAWILQ